MYLECSSIFSSILLRSCWLGSDLERLNASAMLASLHQHSDRLRYHADGKSWLFRPSTMGNDVDAFRPLGPQNALSSCIILFIKLEVSVCPKPSNPAMMSDTTWSTCFCLSALMPIFPGIFTVATLSDSLSNSGHLFSFCHQPTGNFLSMHWDCLSNWMGFHMLLLFTSSCVHKANKLNQSSCCYFPTPRVPLTNLAFLVPSNTLIQRLRR